MAPGKERIGKQVKAAKKEDKPTQNVRTTKSNKAEDSLSSMEGKELKESLSLSSMEVSTVTIQSKTNLDDNVENGKTLNESPPEVSTENIKTSKRNLNAENGKKLKESSLEVSTQNAQTSKGNQKDKAKNSKLQESSLEFSTQTLQTSKSSQKDKTELELKPKRLRKEYDNIIIHVRKPVETPYTEIIQQDRKKFQDHLSKFCEKGLSFDSSEMPKFSMDSQAVRKTVAFGSTLIECDAPNDVTKEWLCKKLNEQEESFDKNGQKWFERLTQPVKRTVHRECIPDYEFEKPRKKYKQKQFEQGVKDDSKDKKRPVSPPSPKAKRKTAGTTSEGRKLFYESSEELPSQVSATGRRR